jgi:tripartite-type tricarboxylate transporter receptor subunit TctC
MVIHRIGRMLFAAVILAMAFAAHAAGYPERPVKIIVAYPAGGANDTVARTISEELSRDLGQPFVVENKGGAGGTIGADIASKAPADGYTLFMAAGAHALAPSLHRSLPYDIVNDFQPVSQAAIGTYMLVVHPSVKATTVAELVALAKANPGKLSYASSGVGAPPHLAGVLFQQKTGTELNHVAYKGDTPAITDLVGGQVQLAFISPGALIPHIRAGRLRPLAVTSQSRSSVFPDLPTLDEAGVKGYALGTWWGLLAPAGTPDAIVDTLAKAMAKATSVPAVKERFESLGFEAHGSSPAEFGKFIKEEVARYSELAKSAGVVAQ